MSHIYNYPEPGTVVAVDADGVILGEVTLAIAGIPTVRVHTPEGYQNIPRAQVMLRRLTEADLR